MLRPLLLLFSLTFSFVTSAAREENGRVNMNGVIFNSACNISSDNTEQTVDLGVITLQSLAQSNTATIFPFTIKLISCVLTSPEDKALQQRLFSLKFDGPSEPGSSWFTLGGEAQGLVFEIHDEQDNTIVPGTVINVHELSAENKTLNYSLHLNKKSLQVTSGRFHTAVNFTLVYQ
ncbi:fimbrial protein [Serratia sp. L9]|uniref:fimbrial protein n=1 Tax=Serratia sp. L9 TaxID=3423946 RepID=UPI003D675109